MASSSASPRVTPLPAERFFHTSLSLLILTSILTLVSTGKLDIFTSLAGPLAALYKGYRWWHRCPAEISSRAATWLVLAYLVFFPLDAVFLSHFLVGGSANPPLFAALVATVHFLIYVTLVRFYSASSERDTLFLAMLSFAGILAAAVLTVDTTFLIFFIVYLLFGVATFAGMELRRGALGAVSPASNASPARERKLSHALGLAALSVALGTTALGSALFFFFPRVSAGYLGRTSFNPSLMTGFNDSVELGQIGEIKKNSAVIMRVQTGKPVGYDRLRWRGVALTTFDGKRWTTIEHGADTLVPSADGWIYVPASTPKSELPGPGILYTVFLEPLGTDAIFVPGRVVSLKGNFTGEAGSAFSTLRRNYIFRDFTGSLLNPFHNYTAIRYVGFSRLPSLNVSKLRTAPTDYPDEVRGAYLQLPKLDPRIPKLAQEITRNAPTPVDKALAIEGYLRTHFTYTLNLTGKPGDDPLAHFLFETRAGHCEYFASAMAIMTRTLGIPSREVNGFLPGEFNDLGGDYIVRASNAHSWVEVYFPGNGWQTFDPTPPAAENTMSVLTRLGQYADWLSLTWSEWVVGYDFAHQMVLAQNLQRSSRNWSDAAHSWFNQKQRKGKEWIKSWQFQHGALRLVLPIALVFFLVALRFDLFAGLISRILLFFQLRPSQSPRSNPQLASRLYAELLRTLARRGFLRIDSQTPLEFAAAVNAPNLSPALQEFTQIYTRARFGGAPCDTSRLRTLLAQIRTALRSR